MNVGEVNIRISADTADVNRGLNDTQNRLQQLPSRFEEVTRGFKMAFGFAMQDMIAKMGEKLLDFAKNSVEVASRANELQNVIQQTFKNNSAEVMKWSEISGDAMGRSTLAMSEYAAQIGAVLAGQGMGSAQVLEMSEAFSKLAVDMGSFWNVADEQAFNALRSAITGELEPMKRFGVVMTEANLAAFALKEGITKKISAMSEGEKTILRYNFLLENTKLAHGDAERTIGGFANQTKVLKANIEEMSGALGEKLMPVANQIITKFNEVFLAIKRAVDEGSKGAKGQELLKMNWRERGELSTPVLEKSLEGLQKSIDNYSKMLESARKKGEGFVTPEMTNNLKVMRDVYAETNKILEDRKKLETDLQAQIAKSTESAKGTGLKENLKEETTVPIKFEFSKAVAEMQANIGIWIAEPKLVKFDMKITNFEKNMAALQGKLILPSLAIAPSPEISAEEYLLDFLSNMKDVTEELGDTGDRIALINEALAIAAKPEYDTTGALGTSGAGARYFGAMGMGQGVSESPRYTRKAGQETDAEYSAKLRGLMIEREQAEKAMNSMINLAKDALGGIVQGMSKSLSGMNEKAQEVGKVVTNVAGKAIQGDFAGAGMAMLQPMFDAIGQTVMPALIRVFTPLVNALSAIGTVIGSVLTPIILALAPIFDMIGALAEGILVPAFEILGKAIALFVNIVIIPITNAIIGIIKGIGGVLSWLGSLDILGVKPFEVLKSMGDKMQSLEYVKSIEEQKKETEKLTEKTKEATAAMQNIPQGIKLALKRFEAATAGETPAIPTGEKAPKEPETPKAPEKPTDDTPPKPEKPKAPEIENPPIKPPIMTPPITPPMPTPPKIPTPGVPKPLPEIPGFDRPKPEIPNISIPKRSIMSAPVVSQKTTISETKVLSGSQVFSPIVNINGSNLSKNELKDAILGVLENQKGKLYGVGV